MHPDFPVYEMVRNGKMSIESVDKLNPAQWKHPELTKQNEVGPLKWSSCSKSVYPNRWLS